MKKVNLPLLILTVFIISWIGVLPSLLNAYGVEIPKSLNYLELLMTLGPILGAVIFIYRVNGKPGLKHFFKRILIFRTSPLVIFIAIVIPILFSYLSALLGLWLAGSNWPDQFDMITIATNGFMIFAVYLIINTEELAWRGLVFDQLLDKHGYFKACLILAPIWWLFHVPLFLYPDGHPAGYGLFEFTFIVLSQTFILGWIYIQSKRSLLYVHLHHQLINGFGQAFPIFPIFIGGDLIPLWVMCAIMMILAVVLTFGNRTEQINDPNH